MKNKKKNRGMRPVLVILLVLSSATVRGQRQWTLDECMDYAIAHNTEMKHLLNEQKRREINVQASKDARLPRIEGDMGGYVSSLHFSGHGGSPLSKSLSSRNRFDADESLLSMGLAATVPLYTKGRLSGQIKANKHALMAAAEDVRSTEKNLRIQVAAAYLQVLYNKGEAKIVQEQLEVSRQLLKQASSLFDKGKRPKSDVVEATAMVSRDEAMLTAAEGDITLATLDLKQLLNLPDSLAFDICEPSDPMDAAPLIQADCLDAQPPSRHPALLSMKHSIQEAEQGVKMARSGYFPTLSLVGGLSTCWVNMDTKVSHSEQVPLLSQWNTSGIPDLYFNSKSKWRWQNFLLGIVGLKLSIPIFNAFETRAFIRTAKVNLEDAKLAYEDARQHLQKDIQQARQGAMTAYKRFTAETKAEAASALSYRYALKRYEAGMATFFDLSQSRQQWVTAAENALRTQYEYLIKKRILDIQTQTE